MLDNEAKKTDGVNLIGVDYLDTIKEEEFEQILQGLNLATEKSKIILKHVPNHLSVAEKSNINSSIYGHTHQGQLFPLGYAAKAMFKGFDYGLKNFGKMSVYVSSGCGTWGPPLRFLTKSEIVEITFI